MHEDKTPEQIKRDILSGLKSDLDKREGSFTDDMAGPVAVELYKGYQALNAVEPMVWVNETSGSYLDLAAEDLGLAPRKAGTAATVALEVTGTAGYTVPVGMGFTTANGIVFDAVTDTRIPPSGTVEVPAKARKIGAAGNVETGTILYQYQNDSRINAVTNPAAAQGGTDPESDASLYARIVSARQKPATSGNRYDYERWASETAGVGYAKCTPVQYGPGTVGVLIVDGNRQPVDDAVVTACAAHIEQVRPIGAAVTVQSAEALAVNVSAAVTINDTTTHEKVQSDFVAALDGYLRTLAFDAYTVLYNRVGALLIGVDGVTDYAQLTLNGQAENLTIGVEQVPICGEVVFL